MFGTSAFQLAWGPFAYAHEHDPDAKSLFARVLTLYTAVASGLALLLGLFAPELLAVARSASYEGAAVPGALSVFGVVAFGGLHGRGPRHEPRAANHQSIDCRALGLARDRRAGVGAGRAPAPGRSRARDASGLHVVDGDPLRAVAARATRSRIAGCARSSCSSSRSPCGRRARTRRACSTRLGRARAARRTRGYAAWPRSSPGSVQAGPDGPSRRPESTSCPSPRPTPAERI
jgi:hypothetical protein